MVDLTYYVAVTLDGYIAGPDGGTAFFPTDGDHLPALAAAYPETFPARYRDHLGIADAPNERFDTVVMGRRTYQPALDAGLTSPYPHLDQHVVSTSLGSVDDPAITVVDADPVGHVRALKRGDRRGIWLCGGGVLAAALVDEIDELILKVNPVVIGDGRPLIDRGFAAHPFVHLRTETYDSGVCVLHLRRDDG